MKGKNIRLVLAAIGVVAIGGCVDSTVTGPSSVESYAARDSAAKLLGLFRPKLVFCPSATTQSTTSVIDGLGGVLSVAGTSVSIPVGALLAPANVTLTVPASPYMEIEVSVEGSDHFIFELPVVISLNYSRCTSFLVRFLPVHAWYIDSETKALLERMPGIDDKLTRTVTFPTTHFSGYAIAN
jgi:hypothetical protein